MSERDKKLLIYLGALIILAVAYFFVGKPYLEKYDQLGIEKEALESELAQKQAEFGKQEFYSDGIKEARKDMQKIIDMFPEDNTDEKSIMFAADAEGEIPIWFSQVKFLTETEVLVNGQQVESASDVEAQNLNESVEAVEAEAEGVQPTEEESAPEPIAEDGEVPTNVDNLSGRTTDIVFTYQVEYEEFKKFLAYIRDYEDRIVIKDIDASYSDEVGIVGGAITLSQYAILGDGRVLPEVDTRVDESLRGKDNIFIGEDYGGSILDLVVDMAVDLLRKIMGDFDSEEVSDRLGTDYFVNVTGVTDNTTGVTVGRADDPEENTYISSAKNSDQSLKFKVSGTDGEYTVAYALGDSKYEDKISKNEDGKIYLRIISSDRIDKQDKVEVSLHVSNSSDIPVVINIDGEDLENPRIHVVERNGDIKVNTN